MFLPHHPRGLTLAEIRVGTSGYSFPDWVGTVYPKGLPQKAWLSYYARWFKAVEINSTYYRIPSPYMMAALVRKVPRGFLFTVKVPKEMTHERGRFEEAVGPFLAAIQPMVQAGCVWPASLRSSPISPAAGGSPGEPWASPAPEGGNPRGDPGTCRVPPPDPGPVREGAVAPAAFPECRLLVKATGGKGRE